MTRFQPGKSGNPGGRPRVLEELRDLARRHTPDSITELARLAKKAKSETARIAAIRELLDRGYGKSTQYVGSSDDMPPVQTHIRVSFVKPDGTEVDDLDEATKP
jgi:hypothetical protein